MANYMAEVAKLLGVEIGEDILIKEYPDIVCVFYNDELYIRHIKDAICTIPSSEMVLHKLLTGKYVIKRKPWKPKDTEAFWHVDACGNMKCWRWENKVDDYLNLYKLGNCYRTKKEAEANRDKWISFYASDEVLEV